MDNNFFNGTQPPSSDGNTVIINPDLAGNENNEVPFNGDINSFNLNSQFEQANYFEQQSTAGEDTVFINRNELYQQITYSPTTQYGQVEPSKKKKKDKGPKIKKPHKKKTGLIVAIISLVLLAGGGAATYFLFFTPEKRLERKLEAARDAYEENDFEEAGDLYEEAVDIDDECFEAMVGDIKSELKLGNIDSVKYEKYLENIRAVKAEDRDENKDYFIEFYMFSEQIFDINDIKLKQILIELHKTYPSENSKGALVKVFLNDADVAGTKGDLEAEVKAYNNVLEIDSENQVAIEGRYAAVRNKIDQYMVDENYDEAEKNINQYKDYLPDTKYDDYLATISKGRQVVEKRTELLTKVEEIMSGTELNDMTLVDGSELANFVSKNIQGHYIFTKGEAQETFTGKAAAIYNFSEGAYYFYYGDFVNGVREGDGKTFMLTDDKNATYESYSGKWANDLPNGTGDFSIMHKLSGDKYIYTVEIGNYTDGIANGDFNALLYVEEADGQLKEYKGQYTANMGQAEDVREQTELTFNIPDGYIMYLIYYSEDKESAWGYWYKEGTTLGVRPFNK